MNVACLLLAAGRSSRMGGPNKLLLTVGGKSLVGRTAHELAKIPFSEIVAVTGHQAAGVSAEIPSLTTVYNPDFAIGMHSSIRHGLRALKKPYDAFLVCLSDQPDFDHEVVLGLMSAFELAPTDSIVCPVFKTEKGHPVLISSLYRNEVLAEKDGDHGCSYLFKRYPDSIVMVPTTTDVLKDIDEPKDYVPFGGCNA